MIANVPKEDLKRLNIFSSSLMPLGIGYLHGMNFIIDECHTFTVGGDYVPYVQDFAMAKTGKEQLQARLSPKKVKTKPSGLLSKLVGKK